MLEVIEYLKSGNIHLGTTTWAHCTLPDKFSTPEIDMTPGGSRVSKGQWITTPSIL